MKNQKGITLIALIITIIVMLILVGVSVTVALNGGLFNTAQDAVSKTEAAGEKERLLSIVLGTLDDKGIVDSNKLTTALTGTDFTLNADGTITSTKTGKTYIVGQRGSVTEQPAAPEEPPTGESGAGVTLTWTHTDSNRDLKISLGDVVRASNGEIFYVIATPGTNDETVKLLAAKCVDTRTEIDGKTNTNYNKQSDTYGFVSFDVGEWDEDYINCYKPGTTTPITNVYANASIKELVETYVTETLGLNANQGRLLSYSEAVAFLASDIDVVRREDIIYGGLQYWLGTPYEINGDIGVWLAFGVVGNPVVPEPDLIRVSLHDMTSTGLRPVVELPLSMID